MAQPQQFTPQLGPRHSRHCNVEDQASCLLDEGRLKEIASRRKHFRGQSELLEKIRQRFAHGLVVIDYGYQYASCVHMSASCWIEI